MAWICALEMEYAVAKAMLDEIYEDTPTDDSDDNHYTFGRIWKHNVVIASLPAGSYGTTSAATVATQLARSFGSIKIRLMVGIGGGVPTSSSDIRLGDVVVSQPQGIFGGVVQYDLGKKTQGGKFERTGQLNRPPPRLLNALTTIKGDFEMMKFDLGKYFQENLIKHTRMLETYDRPHKDDELYQTGYHHKGDLGKDCVSCDRTNLIKRNPGRSPKEVKFHYGTIASGNSLIRDGTERDKISRDLGGILCFEMEAAGLMNNFSCLVIRGICDYADSHKNKSWQRFAAATAALYAKNLLSKMPASEQPAGQQHGLSDHEISAQQNFVPLSQWTPRPAQMFGSPSPIQWASAPGPPIELQSSPSLSQLALELGQPIEEQSGLPSGQPRSGFVGPIDPYRSMSPYNQLSTPEERSIFNQPAIGYQQSALQHSGPSSDQLRQGMVRPSAYPVPAIGQRSLEGVPSTQTHSRPSLAPNRFGHSDSDISKSRGISGSADGIHKSQPGWNKGYVQPREMIYPQFPRPSYPDRTRQRSHGQGQPTPSIPLLPLPHPKPEHSPSRPPVAQYATSRDHRSNAVGPSGSGASKSFDTSRQAQTKAIAPYQGSTNYSGKGQPEPSRVEALQAPEKERKMPSHTNDTKSTAKSQGLARKPLTQSHDQQSHSKKPKSSTTGGQEQSHQDGPRPSQKSNVPKDHTKGPKYSTGNGSGQNDHHDPKPSPKRSNPQGSAKETKLPEKHGKESAHHSNETARPDHGSVKNIHDEAPPSTMNYFFLNEPHEKEPSESEDDTETASSSRPSIESERSRTPSDVEDYQAYPVPNTQVNDPYSQEYLAYGQQSPPYRQERPFYEQEHYPYRQEPISSGLEYPSFDQPLSTYPGDYNAGKSIGPNPGGEAAEYFSAGSMGEDEYLANQAMNAIAQDEATGSDHQSDDAEGDNSSSYRKSEYSGYGDFPHTEPTQNTRDLEYEEEEDAGCGWGCGGDDKASDDGDCCGWLCCGGERNDDDENGCCGGTWTCCGDEEKSDDGEKSNCCILM